ncbi:transposase [Pedobacter sp. MC2016-05]|uniref:transposase n=1 Tax=unclassified Pedobacter TaxID=2628915 RepID=UPI0022453BEE|nr:transposase [Pedobacter sp. MC2016-05]MCX2476306.1 transposase [Pedobacter sp. MC2016-05]
MSRRMFDESFRKMAVELSYTKGSVKEVADELGVSQTLLSKWRQRESDSSQGVAGLTEDQKMIKKLQKELKDAQMERDILKKAVGIFSKGDGRYSDL